jgi:hypothetical protein
MQRLNNTIEGKWPPEIVSFGHPEAAPIALVLPYFSTQSTVRNMRINKYRYKIVSTRNLCQDIAAHVEYGARHQNITPAEVPGNHKS